ncbi:protein DYAD-like [Euphorbia lathyris]|uniref:protein DYAD-like n=1 Tax=Euphorbia lathyris TaxID=212925 RepID=UPI0033130AB4
MSEFLLHAQSQTDDPADHIYVGSYYEIDHSKLPPKSPDQLNSIRIVMVNEKTRMRVSLRFSSIYSLKDYISETNSTTKLPLLDEKYTIGSEIAAEALYRRISDQEITQKKNLWHFWVVPSVSAQRLSTSSVSISRSRSNIAPKKGCLSELEDTGAIKWGQRRHVRYLARHKCKSVISCNVTAAGKEEIDDEEEEREEEEDDEEEENAVEEEIDDPETRKNSKRKQLQRSCKAIQKNKRPKRENKNDVVVYKHKKKKVLKNSIDRWSAERYKLAEVNMLKIMKEQHAVFGRPILRPELRAEARKLIGDTGLLDHLLKHMAGKVAPGGEERFRRRHNAEGAMEYWLEKADLVEIRREAGVQDSYWTPPPGWHPGDNPTRDPICAREFKSLKEEISNLKKNLDMLISKKNEEEEAIVATPISSISGCSIEHDSFVIPLKEMYIDLMNKKTKIEEQLLEISQSLCCMEEEREKLKAKLEEPNRTESSDAALIALSETASTAIEIEREEAAQQNKKALAREERAAEIERLKSGFRICKPQGSFLWPNRSLSSPQLVVHFEDLFSVPTPPSVSSTTATQPQPQLLPSPTSPVKPLAVMRPVSSPLSSQSNTSESSMINLNEFPSNQNDNGTQSPGQNSSFPVTYQRRNHGSIACVCCMPDFVQLETEKKDMSQWKEGDQGEEVIKYCDQQQQGCCSTSSTSPCLPTERGTTLPHPPACQQE